MKKTIAALLAGLMAASALAGCGSSSSSSQASDAATTAAATADTAAANAAVTPEWDEIAAKGEMVIGITYFEPMNYMDENGVLTGFETEFATAVCSELGVTPKFQEIEWESKEVELSSKTIDCIWNGLTITEERQNNMDISVPYMQNKQIIVCKAENAEKYKTAEGVAGATVVAEAGSAGEDVAKEDEFFKDAKYTPVDAQSKALLEVKSGTSDIAIIDYVMSIGTLKEGSDYADLSMVESVEFAPEQYGIAFGKNTDTVSKVNEAIQKVAQSGKLAEIAEKYNLTDLMLVK